MTDVVESAYQDAQLYKKFEVESSAWNEGYIIGFKSSNGLGGCIIIGKRYGIIAGIRNGSSWKFKTVIDFSL